MLCMGVCLLLGLFAGSVISDISYRETLQRQTHIKEKQDISTPSKNTPPLQDKQTQKRLAELEKQVTVAPKDQSAWIALGNAYFDASLAAEAITAYEKALTLGDASADLLTDLGIMYRELHRFEDAVFAFRQAKNRDPKHLQSRLNEGIVLFYDLSEKDEAVAAWKEALAINPDIRLSNGDTLESIVKELQQAK